MKSLKALHKNIKLKSKKFLKSSLSSKSFNLGVKVFALACVLFGMSYFIYGEFVNNVVVSQSEIIRRVSKHVNLPETDPLSVVRVDNAESLRSQNNFYKDINEGDYILAYRNIVVVYDLRNDKVGQVVTRR